MRLFQYPFIIAICGLLFFGAGAQANSGFGLILHDEVHENLDPIQLKQIRNYLKNIELDVKTGIRFGLDRLITIKFDNFPEDYDGLESLLSFEENFPCKLQSNHYALNTDDNEIMLNSKMVSAILSRQTRNKNANGCSHRDSLLRSIEKRLLELPGGDNMDRKLTNDEKDDIQICRNMNSREMKTKMRQNRSLRRRCEKINILQDRRLRFESYDYQIRSVLYNTKMEFDLTSLTVENLTRFDICKRKYIPTTHTSSGTPIKMLGMAIVYMAPGHQTSVAGHVAERYIYCQGEKLKDKMFEYTQMTAGELDNMAHDYRKYPVSDEYLQRQKKTIYIKYKANPASQELEGYGFYNFQKNRDVLEIWPKVSGLEMYDGLKTSISELSKQKERYKNEVDFEPYSLLHNNCTHPIKDRLNKFGGEYKINDFQGFHPTFIFNFLKKKTADKIIIYPSQRTLRKMNMLGKGESIFWENTTFWSKASDKEESEGFMMLYPETHGFLKSLFIMPTHGAINLAAAVVETLVGILSAPLKWLSKIPGFKFLAPSKKMQSHFAKGLNGITLGLGEMFGIRLRYPPATDWTEDENKLIYEELPHRDPKVLDYLLEKVQE